jgi:Sulfotransferase family
MNPAAESVHLGKLQTDWINVPPVFIVGCPRSGTTLLRLMLTAHPYISISSEGAHIYHLSSHFSSYADQTDMMRGLEALHQDLESWLEKVKFISAPSFDQLLDWVGRFGMSLRSIITFYGTWEARPLGKNELIWWGDNAPYHVHQIPFFDSLFPASKFLLVIRDPRDTCASRKHSLSWRPDIEVGIGDWRRSLLDGLVAGMTLGPKRVKNVRYEELVTTPREVLQGICNFLGVEYTEEMLTYYESPAAIAVGGLDHHRNVLKPVFATSIGKYREILTPEEIDIIEQQLFTSMCQLGYISYEEYQRRSPLAPKEEGS